LHHTIALPEALHQPPSTLLQAYNSLNELYAQRLSQERYVESFFYGEAFNGIIALNVTSLNLNPSDQTLYLSITGRPFGPITYRGNSDLLALAFPTATPGADPKLSTMGQSCSVRTARTPFCGDLTVVFGDQLLLYASGDGMARRTFGVNMEAVAPYDNYPFDVYEAKGLVKVSSCSMPADGGRCSGHSVLQTAGFARVLQLLHRLT
jgi:hypothetical protein